MVRAPPRPPASTVVAPSLASLVSIGFIAITLSAVTGAPSNRMSDLLAHFFNLGSDLDIRSVCIPDSGNRNFRSNSVA